MALKNFCNFNRCRLFSKCIASTFLSSRHHDIYTSAKNSWWKQPFHWISYYFLNIYSCMQSQIQQILTKIQKYTLWILKELYTTFLRHRLIGCLICNIKEKTLFKFDRYWDERPLGWKHFKRQQCFRLRIVWAQFMTKALHNKIYISIWCNVIFWNLYCVQWCSVTLVNTIKHTFPTSEIKLLQGKKPNTKSMFYIRLFIKNTLTNLFSSFYGGSHPINKWKQIVNEDKWQCQKFTCPWPMSKISSRMGMRVKGEGRR